MNSLSNKNTNTLYPFRAPNDIPRTPKGFLATPTQSDLFQISAGFVGYVSPKTGQLQTDEDSLALKPRELYEVIWRIQNTGINPWPKRCRIKVSQLPTKDERSSFLKFGQTYVLHNPEVPPGSTFDVHAAFPAPSTPGNYFRKWRLTSPKDIIFGPVLTSLFEVDEHPNP